ncbi:hypothetical protein PN498_10845 [Oscillatoria sp. CS-180]|nr:hypothetical protein [Oscillatoria sp. CS-180]MDB9526487.1 hypothetical protein [Oscillatoria sp. CS-180]
MNDDSHVKTVWSRLTQGDRSEVEKLSKFSFSVEALPLTIGSVLVAVIV